MPSPYRSPESRQPYSYLPNGLLKGGVQKLFRTFLPTIFLASERSGCRRKVFFMELHTCQCSHCVAPGDHPDKELHRRMNVFLSRLDEHQRRWYAALESQKVGHGGDRLLSL